MKRIGYVDFEKVSKNEFKVIADYKEVGMATVNLQNVTFSSSLPMFDNLVENTFENLEILESQIKMTFY